MAVIRSIYARSRKLAALVAASELSAGANAGSKKKERTERKRHRWEVEREVVGKEGFARGPKRGKRTRRRARAAKKRKIREGREDKD